jgi:hypothetical protein
MRQCAVSERMGGLGCPPNPPLTPKNAATEKARMLEAESADLTALTKVCRNAFKQYLRTRPGASSESQVGFPRTALSSTLSFSF